jgi:hypothetical protein
MEINKPLYDLLSHFNSNWGQHQDRLCVGLSDEEISNIENHPIRGELVNLINGKGGSLPFFSPSKITWCTMAPNSSRLQKVVEQLQAWIIPSYGWQGNGDGYKTSDSSGDPFQQAISKISPTNYFRWQSSREQYSLIERKLATRYQLEEKCPVRKRRERPSLYELRTQFQTALTLGNRELAEKAISLIDAYELDKALNTHMMRIRLWHHFREFECIKTYPNLPDLRALPSLPDIINECIQEALGEKDQEPSLESKEKLSTQYKERLLYDDWEQWFVFLVEQKDAKSARTWLADAKTLSVDELKPEQINSYSERWDSLFIVDELREQHKHLINEAVVKFLGDFVRESEFPRRSFSKLYLSLLRLWGKMNAGTGIGREEGHVLLELANALFELNYEIDEAKSTIEEWWDARPVPSQLSFALDAIELLVVQHPDIQDSENLWFKAVDLAKRNPHLLLESEKVLWRNVGLRIGFEEADILQYLPVEQDVVHEDLLVNANLKKIAIVCMREKQAAEAEKMIQVRTGAKVSIVSTKVAGTETDRACSCDVVLFVWLATTHAVFRGFDDFDRSKLCYVQGTGAASIVRALERWCKERVD